MNALGAMAAVVEHCRLCQGELAEQFSLPVLGRFNVAYFRCSDCGSLQTEKPYWLEEAYKLSLTFSDVGAVNRCLENRAAILLIARCLTNTKHRMLDFGGGHGLLCRLLRDVGVDAWTFDSVNESDLAQAFRVDVQNLHPGAFRIVTAFEVLEHFSQPDAELAGLFGLQPEILITSTETYHAALGKDWWYLSPTTGQHIFFYTDDALQRVADRFGYHLYRFGGLQIFSRSPVSSATQKILRVGLSRHGRRLLRVMIEAAPKNRYIAEDYRTSVEAERRMSTPSPT